MREGSLAKAKYWSDHIEAAGIYPGSVSAYCRAHGLEVSSFYWWRRKLRARPPKCSPPSFLPVVVRDTNALTRQPMPASKLPDARWVAEVMLHLARGLA